MYGDPKHARRFITMFQMLVDWIDGTNSAPGLKTRIPQFAVENDIVEQLTTLGRMRDSLSSELAHGSSAGVNDRRIAQAYALIVSLRERVNADVISFVHAQIATFESRLDLLAKNSPTAYDIYGSRLELELKLYTKAVSASNISADSAIHPFQTAEKVFRQIEDLTTTEISSAEDRVLVVVTPKPPPPRKSKKKEKKSQAQATA